MAIPWLQRGEHDCRYCVAAAAVLIIALGVGIQAIRHGHVATALAALLFVPAAILLAGIGLSGGTVPRAGRD